MANVFLILASDWSILLTLASYWSKHSKHLLQSIDLVCMKKLDQKVNIIPIIAKTDTINKQELQGKIMSELREMLIR